MAKNETEELVKRALASLVLGIELFNRPHEGGRKEAVLLQLQHAFEMLLKACIFESTGKVFNEDGKYSYSFEKCLTVAYDNLKLLTKDERAVLSILDAHRDVAAHYYQEFSEDLLYVQAQAAVSLFAILLDKALGRKLAELLPNRVLPISAKPPRDLKVLLDSELSQVDDLILGGAHDAVVAARLRPIVAMATASRDTPQRMTEAELKAAMDRRKEGKGWEIILPEITQLRLVTEGDGIPISIRIAKDADIAVRIVKDGEPVMGTVIKQEVNIWDKFNLNITDLTEKLSEVEPMVTGPKVRALMLELGINADPECFHELKRRSQIMKGYSKKALDSLRKALEGGMKIADVWEKHKATLSRRKKQAE